MPARHSAFLTAQACPKNTSARRQNTACRPWRSSIATAYTARHDFISLRRKPLLVADAERAFRTAACQIGLRRDPGPPRPTIHALRHTFAVRALEACPDDRDRITQHMVALSTYLGHGHVGHTYWYLEATPQLMRDVSERCERFVTGGHP